MNNEYCFPIILFTFLLLGGCCLKSINLKPELNALDLKAVKAGSADFNVIFEFKDCCPTDKQKEIALKMQDSVQKDYEKLQKGEITLDKFNEAIKAAKDAIEGVILVCSANRSKEILPSATGIVPVETREQKLKAAWDEVEKALKVINEP
ncbi:MAG: hypothetical protein HY096_00225 [Nitrospinae bacterium]|nr:hypothetical protein [Nitrospinota bacterium]